MALLAIVVAVALHLASSLALPQAASNSRTGHSRSQACQLEKRVIEFVAEEITRSSVDVSPDGRTIVFDALGDIYTVPIQGGVARLLISGQAWDASPRFSKDGAHLAFLSDRGGSPALWIARADGSSPSLYGLLAYQRLLHRPYIPDSVIAANWMPGNRSRRAEDAIGRLPSVSNVTTSPDGQRIAFARYADGVTALIVREIATRSDRILIDSIAPMMNANYIGEEGVPAFAFTPDGTHIVFSNRGRLVLANVQTGTTKRIPLRVPIRQELEPLIAEKARISSDPDLRARIIRWPMVTPDGGHVVFGALSKIYVTDITNGRTRRLTSGHEGEFAPAVSPDGRSVAYATWSDTAAGSVRIVDRSTGEVRQLTSERRRYANPVWSPDGRWLAFIHEAADAPQSEFGSAIVARVDPFSSNPKLHDVAKTDKLAFSEVRSFPSIAIGNGRERIFLTESVDWREGDHNDATRESRVIHQKVVSFALDGSDRREHLRFPAVDEFALSPDGKRIALARRERVFVLPFPDKPPQPRTVLLDGSDSLIAAVDDRDGGTYVTWLDSATLTWNKSTQLYRFRLREGRPALLSDIDLRVPRHRPRGFLAFQNARIITMRGTDVITGTVLVKDDRIAAVGTDVKTPRGTHTIDASGLTIIPGLADVHTHMNVYDRDVTSLNRWKFLSNLAYGVTTTYDPAAPTLDVFASSELVEAGALLGPRVYSSGRVIFGQVPGRQDFLPLRDLQHARQVVRRYGKYGVALLKHYVQPQRQQQQWLASAAREAGIRITAEGGGFAYDLAVIADGYTGLEHSLRTSPIYDDVIQFIARSGVHWTPTLTVAAFSGALTDLEAYYTDRTRPQDDPKWLRFAPQALVQRMRDFQANDSPQLAQSFSWHGFLGWMDDATIAARVAQAGGAVSTGSHGIAGLGLHWEMWALTAGGLSNHEALRAGTFAGAKKLGLEGDLGSLEPGKIADFVVLDRNPLDDIRNSLTIRYVVANGFVYHADDMTQAWPARVP